MKKIVNEINLHSNMASLNFRCVLNKKTFRIVYTLQLKKKNYSSFTPKQKVRIFYFYHMRLINEFA